MTSNETNSSDSMQQVSDANTSTEQLILIEESDELDSINSDHIEYEKISPKADHQVLNLPNSDEQQEEFFCKHYIEPKKPHQKVKFEDKVKIKPSTEVNTIITSTLEREEREILNCETIEELKEMGAKLGKQLDELTDKKKQGYDIAQEYEDLEWKSEIFDRRKKIIIERENNKRKEKQNSIVRKICSYFTEDNLAQVLVVFYNSNSICNIKFKNYLTALFDSFKKNKTGITINIAMCCFGDAVNKSITGFFEAKDILIENSKEIQFKTLKTFTEIFQISIGQLKQMPLS